MFLISSLIVKFLWALFSSAASVLQSGKSDSSNCCSFIHTANWQDVHSMVIIWTCIQFSPFSMSFKAESEIRGV